MKYIRKIEEKDAGHATMQAMKNSGLYRGTNRFV